MKVTIIVEKEVDIKYCFVEAKVRYWEDTEVNGVEDADGTLVPCRVRDLWCPQIDINTGVIANWVQGVKAYVHYKVCDAGTYYLKTEDGTTVLVKEGYVPGFFPNQHFGDYIIMSIDETGKITDWENPDYEEAFADFETPKP